MKRLFGLLGLIGIIGVAISAGLPTPADAQDGGANPTPNPYQQTTSELMAQRNADRSQSGEVIERIRPGVPFTTKAQNPDAPLVSSYGITRTSAAIVSESMVKTLLTTWQSLIAPRA